MRNSLDRTMRRLATVIRRFKDDQAGQIPMDVGFSLSAWFFVTLVALTLLDAYLLGGKGIGFYLSVPGQILASSGNVIGA